MDEINLEGEQYDAFLECCGFLLSNNSTERELVFSAPGGTGKTYVLRKVLTFLAAYDLRLAVVAFTGRAASQLSDEGIEARTCHSLLYAPLLDQKGNLVGWEKRRDDEILDECGDGIIVDEGSMIPSSMYNIFRKLGVKVIYCGDNEQLDPVDTENANFNVMTSLKCKTITLTKNRRFDENNGIGFLASHLRTTDSFPRVKKEALIYVNKASVMSVQYHRDNQYDMIMCGMNKTRRKLNDLVRCARGFEGITPQVGETVVCLQNTVVAEKRINNGELFTIEGIFSGENEAVYLIVGEKGEKFSVRVAHETWESEAYPERAKTRDQRAAYSVFGFGYALSVHKCQGSTFRKALFVDEDVSFFLVRKKFRYTGCTRAAKELTVAL